MSPSAILGEFPAIGLGLRLYIWTLNAWKLVLARPMRPHKDLVRPLKNLLLAPEGLTGPLRDLIRSLKA